MASTISLRHESAFLGQADEFRLLIKRNCSISPAGLFRVFALLALATLGIGAGFAAAGAWLAMPFAWRWRGTRISTRACGCAGQAGIWRSADMLMRRRASILRPSSR